MHVTGPTRLSLWLRVLLVEKSGDAQPRVRWHPYIQSDFCSEKIETFLKENWDSFSEKLRQYLRNFQKGLTLFLGTWSLGRGIEAEASERCRQWGKQNEPSCLLLAPTPVEAVETQRVSAQRVYVRYSACSHQACKIVLASFSNYEEACNMLFGKGRVRTQDLGYQA